MAGIVFADAWMWSPFVMLLVLAGLVSVPKYLYEAAAIDRVSVWRQFWSITFPYIRGLLMLALLFRTIEAFKLFDVVFLLTEGGPGHLDRDHRASMSTGRRSSSTRPANSTAHLLHPALHGDRADQPLSLSRQPARQGGVSDGRHGSSCCERPGSTSPRRRRGRLGPHARRGDRQPDLLLPGPVDHPDRLQELQRRAGGAAEIPVHADARELRPGVQPRLFGGRRRAGHQASTSIFFNSIFIAGTSVLLALVIGTLAAFGFSRYPLKGNDTYLFIILTTRMLPAIVVIIPIILMFRVTGLAGTYIGIILLYTAFNLPFTIWMMKSFFDELSPDVEDAARLDGSSDTRVFFKICLPQVLAGIAATAVFGLILTWNEYLFALLLTGVETRTVPVAMAQTIGGDIGVRWGLLAAIETLFLIPVILVTFFLQNHLLRGVTFGTIKR